MVIAAPWPKPPNRINIGVALLLFLHVLSRTINQAFFTGWFDYWGGPHHGLPLFSFEDILRGIFGFNASVNFFMFTGGSNFGFMNGANNNLGDIPQYRPQTEVNYSYNAINSSNNFSQKKKCKPYIIA